MTSISLHRQFLKLTPLRLTSCAIEPELPTSLQRCLVHKAKPCPQGEGLSFLLTPNVRIYHDEGRHQEGKPSSLDRQRRCTAEEVPRIQADTMRDLLMMSHTLWS